eukprot:504707_1
MSALNLILFLIVNILSLINCSIVFNNVTDIKQLTPSYYYEYLGFEITSFSDTVDNNKSYHFLSDNVYLDYVDGTILSNIYDNNLNEWNNINNPINTYYKLPFNNTFINNIDNPYGSVFDQCTNPLTNDIIICYINTNNTDQIKPLYIFCKIFYNNDYNNTNKPYWTTQFIISNAITVNPQIPGIQSLSIICFNDSYFISWIDEHAITIRYTLIDLNTNIINFNKIIIHSVDIIDSLQTIKSNFNDNDFILLFNSAYIMCEYINIKNPIKFFNTTNPNKLKIYNPQIGDYGMVSLCGSDDSIHLLIYHLCNVTHVDVICGMGIVLR